MGCPAFHVVNVFSDGTQSCHMECHGCPDMWFCDSPGEVEKNHESGSCKCPLIEDDKNAIEYVKE